MSVVAGSSTRIYSPIFVDLDESPAWVDGSDAVGVAATVTSVSAGTLDPLTPERTETTGVYQAVLDADGHLSAPDRLTVTWTGAVESYARTLTQQVEVAGGQYLGFDELASLRTIPDVNATPVDIRLYRDAFERLAERARGVAYVPRFAVDTFNGPTVGNYVRLSNRRPRSIVSVIVDGTPVTDLDGYVFDSVGRLFLGGGHLGWSSELQVAYIHGHDAPPPAITEAGRQWIRAQLLASASDHSRTLLSITNMASGETYRFGTADWSAGRYTGMESVDQLINSVADERIPGLA